VKQIITILSEKWCLILEKFSGVNLCLSPLPDIWISNEIAFFSMKDSRVYDIGDIYTGYGAPSTNIIYMHYQWSDNHVRHSPIRIVQDNPVINPSNNSLLVQPPINSNNHSLDDSIYLSEDEKDINLENDLDEFDEFDPLEFLGIYNKDEDAEQDHQNLFENLTSHMGNDNFQNFDEVNHFDATNTLNNTSQNNHENENVFNGMQFFSQMRKEDNNKSKLSEYCNREKNSNNNTNLEISNIQSPSFDGISRYFNNNQIQQNDNHKAKSNLSFQTIPINNTPKDEVRTNIMEKKTVRRIPFTKITEQKLPVINEDSEKHKEEKLEKINDKKEETENLNQEPSSQEKKEKNLPLQNSSNDLYQSSYLFKQGEGDTRLSSVFSK
jgi:hypothetical protein